MFLDKYKFKPVYAPDLETGGDAGGDEGGAPPDTGSDPAQHDGPGSGRSDIRKSLESGFAKARQSAETETDRDVDERPVRAGKHKKADRVGGRLAQMQDSGTEEPTTEGEGEVDEVEISSPYDKAPDGWDESINEAWSQADPALRAAVHKREQQMAKGVKQLKDRYAEVDQALAPHMQAIQAHGHTPGRAIHQLFSWFDALSNNPQVAFPALANAFGHDLRQFIPRPQQPQQPVQQGQPAQGQPGAEGQPPQGQQPRPGIDPRFVQWNQQQFQTLAQQQAALEQRLQQFNQTKTEETLEMWSRDKEYFQQAREHMAYLIQSGAIPLKDGRVDLDTAYERACWALPEVRNDILHKQAVDAQTKAKAKKEAERKAQAEQAQKAIRAAGSLPLSAPGTPPAKGTGQPLRRKSVGESLREAIAQHRE